MTDWGKRVFLGSLLGALLGLLLGLGLGRLLWPPVLSPAPATANPVDTPPEPAPTLPVPVEADTGPDADVIMISAFYAVDGDLERARQRLVALGFDDPAQAVANLAQLQISAGNHQVAVDLATLASDLGYEPAQLLAYVATATPTWTPLPTDTPAPTRTPTATFSPEPSLTPPPTSTPSPASSSPAATRRPPTQQPPTATPRPPSATPLPLVWDHRVDILSPPVKLLNADVAPGQPYWRLVRLEWWKPSEGGNTLLYVSTFNESGQPVWGQEVVVENGGHTSLYTEPKPGEQYGVNFRMNSTLNSYQVFVGGDLPSDRVVGLGLGEALGTKEHTTFVLEFQRSTK